MSKKAKIATYIKPQKGYLLLEVLSNEQPQSFTISDKDQIPQRGKVLRVGEKTYHDTGHEFLSPADVGDVVIHSGFGYEDVRIKGEKFRLCPFGKVIGIVKEKDYEKILEK